MQDEEIAFGEQLDGLLVGKSWPSLSAPWNVVLTGRPNVEISLMNALLGYQSHRVRSRRAQPDVVTGETPPDGWPFVLSDTAGIRENVEG